MSTFGVRRVFAVQARCPTAARVGKPPGLLGKRLGLPPGAVTATAFEAFRNPEICKDEALPSCSLSFPRVAAKFPAADLRDVCSATASAFHRQRPGLDNDDETRTRARLGTGADHPSDAYGLAMSVASLETEAPPHHEIFALVYFKQSSQTNVSLDCFKQLFKCCTMIVREKKG